MLLTIITFIVILSLLVFAHELGHFLTARKFGLIPEEFGFGLPPRAWGVYKSKSGRWKQTWGKKEVKDAADTIYSVNWLPLGGFVRLGEDDSEIPPEANHFLNKPIWQRAVMLLAGVTMNIILAMGLISLGFMIGLPQVLEDVRAGAVVSDENIQIVEVLPDTPAKEAGLKLGDMVLAIDNEPIDSTDELAAINGQNAGHELAYTIKREDREITVALTPEYIDESGANGVGIGIVETGLVRYPVHIAVWEGVKNTIWLTLAIIFAFYELIKGLVLGQGVGAEIAGPVGIATITGQMARMGLPYIIQFAAMLSINLAIINAFPFPALDGGRVLFLIIEKFKGRPVRRELEGTIHYIGFALLMLLIVVITFKDISRFSENIKFFWDKLF